MLKKLLKVHPSDNVAVALLNLVAGDIINFNEEDITVLSDVKEKHKIALDTFNVGDRIIMYGVLVGTTQCDVARGSLVTTANLKHAAEPYAYRETNFSWEKPDVSQFANKTFNGFVRSNGQVGTANYWLFIPTVFCENRNLDVIKEALHHKLGYAVSDKYSKYTQSLLEAYQNGESVNNINFSPSNTPQKNRVFKNVDGIKFLNHNGGCGGTRADAATLSALLASYANHPNVGGITVLSLGCQHLQVEDFKNDIKKIAPDFDKPLYIFEQQQSESEEELIASAIKKTFEERLPFYQQADIQVDGEITVSQLLWLLDQYIPV
jgi:altronate hydrolase